LPTISSAALFIPNIPLFLIGICFFTSIYYIL
jgi:hypothetical protein